VFGPRLLRLRWMRYLVTKKRLASFDRWFRRRGDAVILIARFLAALRMVAFFTAGTMKMRWRRFLLLDGLGILLMVPLLVWLGLRSAGFIDEMIATVTRVERGILWGTIGGSAVLVLWFWLWRRRRSRRLARPAEAFVQPQRPVSVPDAPVASGLAPAGPAPTSTSVGSADAAEPPPADPAPPPPGPPGSP